MAYRPRRYVRLPKGTLTENGLPIGRGASTREVYALLWQSTLSRRIPGVIRAGVNALAEEFGIPTAKLRKALDELDAHGLIANDPNARLIRIREAIEADPPANGKVIAAWASDFRELPASPVRDGIREAIRRSLTNPEFIALWDSQTDTVSNIVCDTVSHTPVPVVPDPVPDPLPQPISVAEDLSRYLDACERLGAPFDYAAAAARLSLDLQERWKAIPIDEWGRTLRGLATSFLAGDRAKARPTLIDLINKVRLRQELIEGRHEEVGRRWWCAICALDHSILETCPAECGDCHRRHRPENVCTQTQYRLERERAEAERAEADARDDAEAGAAGITREELRAQRKATWWSPTPGGLRASLAASRAASSTDQGGKAA